MVVRKVTDLDHTGIKNSLKEFLKNQNDFSDYDFEGSGLNILLDILAYNTQYTSFYANMIANEMFIDSATMRSSVTSLAKLFGYTPRSATSARAKIDIQFNNVQQNIPNIIIPKNTKFTATKDGISYIFYTDKEYNALSSNNFKIENIEIFEGKRFTFRYTVNSSLNTRYIIPNDNVDIYSLNVYVQQSDVNLQQEVYKLGNDISEYNPQSLIYFIEENSDGKYEIYFGENVYGKQPSNGNIVFIEYTICSGDSANNIGIFSGGTSISGFNNFTITVKEKSNSGANQESIENIRTLAPKSIQVQNRAITAEDYRTLILRDYPNVSDVKVWGGEQASPLQYGKVFITLLPKEGFTITNSIKKFVQNEIIKPYNITTILPEIVDAQYIDIIPDISVTYEIKQTRFTQNELINKVIQTVNNFSDSFLNRFDKTFLFSKFITEIDNTDDSFVSNETSYKCKMTKNTTLGVGFNYTFNFNNPISNGSVITDAIMLSDGQTYYIDDNVFGVCSITGENILRLFKIVNNEKVYIDNDIGRVNYNTGIIRIINLNVFSGNEVSVTMKPRNQNFVSVRENVIRIKQSNINVTMKGI